jgi:hypothetical protein
MSYVIGFAYRVGNTFNSGEADPVLLQERFILGNQRAGSLDYLELRSFSRASSASSMAWALR